MSLFDRNFYDFIVNPSPEDKDSIPGLAQQAKKYGYSGMALVNTQVTETDTENLPPDFSIYHAAGISCKQTKLRSEIQKHSKKNDIIIVMGGDELLNRAAVETPGLDILLQPGEFNHVHARFAHDNSITIGFDIGSLIRNRGDARIRELTTMRRNLIYVRKYDLPAILTANAATIYDLRAPREMAAIASLFGMTQKEASDAMSTTPLEILKTKSQDYVQNGIEVL
ncbi:MAG: hypothetical protein OIN89_05190 [Candidatus Methanoperedens sp.]|jgi:ribonuclease P/MRP protein subunit RPP1|nr:hypothetical protein [Candidatus Methanoperedens sp.]PKL53942.1 MAG: hypothetical protein CVV36_04320 [Candidatus Methanoperedenaceae archaeon HGW-Methanoperedenaceae-1]